MSPPQHPVRSRPDLCPGVLAVHQAADGGLARVRLPGGVLTSTQLRVLAAAARELGDGQLELTSRANVQLRGLAPGAERELSQRLYDAGLLPTLSHERVRNIIASPLSGLDDSYDVLPVVAELDRLLCESPVLADLPGRFLFTLDDGRGDLDLIAADAGARAVDRDTAELRLAGTDTGILVPWADVPRLLTDAATAFLAERAAQRSTAWRLTELEDGPARICARLGLVAPNHATPRSDATNDRRADDDLGRAAAAVGVVPLGRMTAEQAEVLAGLADGGAGTVRVTPWRSVVVPEGDEYGLTAAGLVTDPGSAWVGMTGCAGRPGCAKALADVRGDAARALPLLPSGRPVHWSGCERRCGKPAGAVDVIATGNGYAVDGTFADDVVAAVAARR